MLEDKAARAPSVDTKGAAREMLNKWLEGPVVRIELTPEQQALLLEQTNGRIDATSLSLRPNLDLSTFLSEATDINMAEVATSIAPPPKGTAWVVTGI